MINEFESNYSPTAICKLDSSESRLQPENPALTEVSKTGPTKKYHRVNVVYARILHKHADIQRAQL